MRQKVWGEKNSRRVRYLISDFLWGLPMALDLLLIPIAGRELPSCGSRIAHQNLGESKMRNLTEKQASYSMSCIFEQLEHYEFLGKCLDCGENQIKEDAIFVLLEQIALKLSDIDNRLLMLEKSKDSR